MTSNFFKAITYNVLNIFLYKIILQIHQTTLFFTIAAPMFGLVGTLFSSVYFLISVTNIGFDYFIISHHNSYTSCQKNFKKIIPIFIARLITVLFVIALLWIINYHYTLCPISNILDHTTPLLLAIIIFIFISESIKKSLDALAQMSFLQRSITFFDISTLLMYVIFVWGYYFLYKDISLYTIFLPMAFISIFECFLLTRTIIAFYSRLPMSCSNHTTPSPKVIITQQAINYINQITKALFSPNFFIILFACYFGLSKAGYIKLCTDGIILLYMLLNRSFGLPTAALFSSLIKNKSQDSTQLSEQQRIVTSTFIKITNWYIQFLYTLAIVIVASIFFYKDSVSFSTSIILNILLFIFASFIEYLLIAYEKWYLTQNRSWLLAVINGINLLGYAVLFLVSKYISSNFILLPIILLRVLIAALIIYSTKLIWRISPNFRINRWTIIATTVITFIIFGIQFLISL